MDTETATTDQISPIPDSSTSPQAQPEVFKPQEPIILNPGVVPSQKTSSEKRGFLSTFSLLLAGWLVGNLVILAGVGIVSVVVVGSTGLVKVPVLTAYLFGKETPSYSASNQFYLDSAQEKLDQVKSLRNGESLADLELTQDEINALLDNQISSAADFPIANQSLKLSNNQFVFSGNLVKTNAPVKISGNVDVSSLTAKITITSAKFGKIDIPVVIAASIVDSSLNKIGLSLSGSQIPAQSLKILDGGLRLEQVVNPES